MCSDPIHTSELMVVNMIVAKVVRFSYMATESFSVQKGGPDEEKENRN